MDYLDTPVDDLDVPVDDLGRFPGVDAFYEYRGEPGSDDGPPIWLPVQQGDVFREVSIPGFEEPGSEALAMVFMHPCVMRKGAVLADHITVFRVIKKTTKKRPYERFATTYSAIPLPELLGPESGVYAGEFQIVGTVTGAALDRSNRVMSLSKEGRLLLQQRVVHHFTRHIPPLHDLRNRTRGVEREVELLTDWCEAACGTRGDTNDVVAEAEKEFDEYLSAGDRRDRLRDEDSTNTVVADTHGEIRRRY
ncbi:putative uncharacterized protein [Rhodococcus sp. AW25M09]|uniref:hypothetical protein n=1 Tax=Rhodococcus sp. AW25M09 TaxID=1268303 RepID=UPI0002ABF4B9|nr:hypothetical protein [Rhodococcus sp. AW25M09]CCQ16883.1 putative uncharacterized protein [Rhodococcus sp. AW25M09]